MGSAGKEGLLDLVRVLARPAALRASPLLHHHSNTGGAAAVLLLLHEGDVQPNPWLLSGKKHSAEEHEERESSNKTKHATVLTDCHDDQNQSRDAQDDEEQVAIVDITGRKVGLRFLRARGQLREFLVTQA